MEEGYQILGPLCALSLLAGMIVLGLLALIVQGFVNWWKSID